MANANGSAASLALLSLASGLETSLLVDCVPDGS